LEPVSATTRRRLPPRVGEGKRRNAKTITKHARRAICVPTYIAIVWLVRFSATIARLDGQRLHSARIGINMSAQRLSELDLAQHWIDVPISLNRDDFTGAQTIVRHGFKHLARVFPAHQRRWSRWRNWWMIHLADLNGEWRIAAAFLRRALADRGVQGTYRLSAYTWLARVLGHLGREHSAERARLLLSALRLGAKYPSPELFSVVSQLEGLELLTWSGPARAAFRYLVTECLDPKGRPPQSLDQMRELVRNWRRNQGMP